MSVVWSEAFEVELQSPLRVDDEVADRSDWDVAGAVEAGVGEVAGGEVAGGGACGVSVGVDTEACGCSRQS